MTATTVGYHQEFPLAQLHESPLNPRRTYDPAKLAELAASIKAQGIITPLLARTNAKGAEIAAGHRRLRAAKMAEVTTGPVIIREMTDAEFVEVLNIENLQREDLTPLEEAEGYKLLMTKASYDAKRIAERVGKSEKYVYDRVKLLQLIEPAKALLRSETITAGHGILLARLKPADQKRAIDEEEGGVFTHEMVLEDPEADEAIAEPIKAKSVREVQAWIDEHVKFDPKNVDPMIFPETAEVLTGADKIIPITHNHYVQPSARDAQRIYGPRSWERADGKYGSKTCSSSVTGVIVVGPGRGDSFAVCVNKKGCNAHWAAWMKEAAQRDTAQARETTKTIDTAKKEAQQAREQIIRDATDQRVLAEILGKVKWPLSRLDVEVVLGQFVDQVGWPAHDGLEEALDLDRAAKPEKMKPEELARALVGCAVAGVMGEYSNTGTAQIEKRYKIDRAAIAKDVKAQLKVQEEGEAPRTSTPKKKAAAKKASAKKGKK